MARRRGEFRKVSLDDINRTFIELERLGLLEKTGELRNGQPVWVSTALSNHLEEIAPELLEFILDQDLSAS